MFNTLLYWIILATNVWWLTDLSGEVEPLVTHTIILFYEKYEYH